MAFRDFSSDEIEPASHAIGFFIINWTLLEITLDAWQSITFHNANGKFFKRKMARMLSDKIIFLRDNFLKNEYLLEYRDECLLILDEVERISKTRRTISHYGISKFDPESNTIEFSSLQLDKPYTMHRHAIKRLSARQLLDDATACERLHPRAISIANRLIENFTS